MKKRNVIILLIALLLGSQGITTLGQQNQLDKEFLEAVQNRDVPKITSLLGRGANVNAKEEINGHFALQYAIDWPDVSLVKLLLDKGADVNAMDKTGNTALMDAARRGGPENAAIVKLLIERGADIHVSNDAVILGAARGGEPEVVRLLLAKGLPVNVRDREEEGDTVLMAAAAGGSVETLQILLAAGAEVNATNNEGETALMKAVKLDHRYSPETRLPMIELLLQKGAEINARDKAGRTPLLHSVVQYMSEAGGTISHPEVVQLLLTRGADVQAKDLEGETALLITTGVWQGPIQIVRLLLAKGIDVNAQNKKGISALMIAADKGKVDVVQLLLDKGANLNLKDGEGSTALDHAVAAGYGEIAKLLFGRGARSSSAYKNETELMAATTNFALLRAVVNNKVDEVKELLAAGANVNIRNSQGQTALLLAVEYSYSGVEILTLLLEKGADVNAANSNGDTALMLASERNNSDAVPVLLAHKALVSVRNKKQQTALHIAAGALNSKIVEALLTAGARPGADVTASSAGVDVVQIDVRDGQGRTPLMLAADNEGMVPDDVMELLLGKGADVNARDNDGNTALMLAAKAGAMSGTEFLLSKGAAVNVKNKAGETALKFARRLHENQRLSSADIIESRIVAMLLKAGAKE